MYDLNNNPGPIPPADTVQPSVYARLGAAALLTATIQTICVAHISVHSPAEVQSARAASSMPLLGGVTATIAMCWLTWFASRRLGRIATWTGVNLCVALPVVTALSTGPLSFAIHAEVLTYNLLAILATLICVGVPATLLSRGEREHRVAATVMLVSSLAAAVFFVVHLATSIAPDRIAGVAPTTLCLPLLGLVSMLPIATWFAFDQQRTAASVSGAAISLLIGLRLSLAGTPCSLGSEVADDNITLFGSAIVITALICAFALRPSMERWVRGLISLLTVTAVSLGWVVYSQGYGAYEDSLGDLIASFLAFRLPYPAYVAEWKAVGVLVGLFFGLSCIYANIVSTHDRARGVALGLLMLAGLSFSSPHLILTFVAGAFLLLVEPALHESAASVATEQPVVSHDAHEHIAIEDVLHGLVERIDAPPLLIATPFMALDHTIDRVPVEIRHRAEPGRWSFEIVVGHPGRSHAPLRIVPGKPRAASSGEHPLLRTHRLEGDPRMLESETRLLDALTRFPGAQVEVWDGGFRSILGREDSGLDEDGLEALLLAMVHWTVSRPLGNERS